MGYRSEVVLALDARVVPALMAAFAKCEETQKLCTQETDNLDTDYEGKGNWMMRWDGIKWYESYPSIAMLNSFIEALESDDLSEFGLKAVDYHDGEEYSSLYSYIRMGEDNDDIKVSGYGFESIGISKSIHF